MPSRMTDAMLDKLVARLERLQAPKDPWILRVPRTDTCCWMWIRGFAKLGQKA